MSARRRDGKLEQILFAGFADIRLYARSIDDGQFDGVRQRRRVGIGAGDEGLVQIGQHMIRLGALAIQYPAVGKEVQHDGFGIELSAFDLIDGVFVQDIVPDLRFRPVVGWAAEISDDGFFVPLDAAQGALVLVGETDGMAEFMGGGPAIVVIEADADFRIRGIIEVETQVGVLGPPGSLFPGNGLLPFRALHKSYPQIGAIDPQFAEQDNRTGRSAPCRHHHALRTVQITRQNPVETYFFAGCHGFSPGW